MNKNLTKLLKYLKTLSLDAWIKEKEDNNEGYSVLLKLKHKIFIYYKYEEYKEAVIKMSIDYREIEHITKQQEKEIEKIINKLSKKKYEESRQEEDELIKKCLGEIEEK